MIIVYICLCYKIDICHIKSHAHQDDKIIFANFIRAVKLKVLRNNHTKVKRVHKKGRERIIQQYVKFKKLPNTTIRTENLSVTVPQQPNINISKQHTKQINISKFLFNFSSSN